MTNYKNIQPDWDELAKNVNGISDREKLDLYWTKQCKVWLEDVVIHYGNEYRIEESLNFFIMSNESDRYIELFSAFIERTLKRILFTLKGIASDEGYGKHVAMIFQNPNDYYNYLELMYPEESEIGFSSGVYIDQGYGHFVFPSQVIELSEPIAVHELTHSCLFHLPIPIWLNEGIAVLMEEVLAGQVLYIDKQSLKRHQQYWNDETIQHFWTGKSFHSNDQSQELSYHLAHILVRNLSKDYTAFSNFVNSANYEDAGNKAAIENIGFSLSEIAGTFLGLGNWEPKDLIS